MSFKFGKLKQLVGEKAKITAGSQSSEEFVELQQELTLRRKGIDRLHATLTHYSRQLSKRKVLKDADDPLLPSTNLIIDASGARTPLERLSILLVAHGEEFGDTSAFGRCCVMLGRAHETLVQVTEEFVASMGQNILSGLERGKKNFEEYDRLRKKLEGRRLALDAARTKKEKTKKDSREVDEEVRIAKDKYEDTAEDLHKVAEIIQSDEIQQLRDLTVFLQDELDYASKYKKILEDVKTQWLDETTVTRNAPAKPTALHSFREADASDLPEREKGKESASLVSRLSLSRKSSLAKDKFEKRDKQEKTEEAENSDNERKTIKGKKSSRSLKEKEKEKEKEADKARSRRSSSIFTVPGFGFTKKKEEDDKEGLKDKEKDEKKEKKDEVVVTPSFSNSNSTAGSMGRSRLNGLKNMLSPSNSSASSKDYSSIPSATIQTLPPPTFASTSLTQDTLLRTVRSKWNYTASHSDELSFSVGDRIIVEKEVNDSWWMGMREKTGERGLFPAAYCTEFQDDDDWGRKDKHKRESTEDSAWSYQFNDMDGEDSEAESRNILQRKKIFDSDESSDEEPPPSLPKRPLSSAKPSSSFLGTPTRPLHRSSSSLESGSLTKKIPPPPPPRSRGSTVNQGYVGGSNTVQVIPPGGGILKSGKSPFEDDS